MTARPSGAFCSAPSPMPSAIGIMPMIIASAVISTGRMRVAPASSAASDGAAPSCRRWRANETRRMLFAVATPIVMIAPVSAGTLNVVPVMNSVLLVSFARQRLEDGVPVLSAALEAGATRIRPVLMTALAMIIGMIPMALGIGEGAEQNAPLGRAVIGGLIFATVSTLFFVPVVFAAVHRWLAQRRPSHALNPQNPAIASGQGA